ncbi:MAG TPA: hypothetical protein ENH43_01355 [Phycisphaerales bacterium]|nr:hypothetical protein [Phycisphaerales bacterium]
MFKIGSIFAMGIPEGQLKIVFFDGCYTGRLKFTGSWDLVEGPGDDQGQMNPWPNDMSEALGIFYTDQIYKGWYGKSFAFNFLTYYITWSNNFWDRLRLNDSIYEAISYCIWNTPGVSLRYGPHKNYRLKGFGDIYNIRLQQ